MADSHTSKGGLFSKKLRRTKTKLLQNLGKTQKTKDETLQEHAARLERQHEVAVKFQKDLRNFTHCAKSLSAASKTFFVTLGETYEEEWTDHSQIQQLLEGWDNLWSDYLQKLQDQIQDPLAKYIGHVQPIKTRISKRGRKLIDYDNAKHNLEVLNNAKKKDETKIAKVMICFIPAVVPGIMKLGEGMQLDEYHTHIAKAQEELNQTKKIYEEINNDLHIELQEYYNSRVTCYAAGLRNMFAAEQIFHSEVAKISEKMSEISERLYQENEQHTYTPKRPLRDTMSEGSNDRSSRDMCTLPVKLRSYECVVPNGHEHSENSNSGYESQPSQPGTPREKEVSETYRSPQVYDSPNSRESLDGEKENKKKNYVESDYENANLAASVAPPQEKETSESEHHESLEKEPESKEDYDEEKQTDQEETTDAKQGQTTGNEKDQKDEEVEVREKVSQDSDEKNEQSDDSSSDSSSESSSDLDELDIAPPVPPTEPPGDLANAVTVDDEIVAVEESEDALYEIPKNNQPVPQENLPDNYLYSVIATHPYHGEDEDELSFERNDIIYVISFDDPDEQDDGWLLGIKKLDKKKGVFPENFTKKV